MDGDGGGSQGSPSEGCMFSGESRSLADGGGDSDSIKFKCEGERERDRRDEDDEWWDGGTDKVAALLGTVRTCNLGKPLSRSADVVSILRRAGTLGLRGRVKDT